MHEQININKERNYEEEPNRYSAAEKYNLDKKFTRIIYYQI